MQALLIIDVQNAMFSGENGAGPLNGWAVVARIKNLIANARAAQVPVFYIQHDGGTGDEFDKHGPGFAFVSDIAPEPGDSVTVKKRNSGFYDTDLDQKLKAAGVDSLVICGMQTEYCVDATVRSAFDRHYRVTVVADAHTTFDSQILPAATIIAHTQHIWNGRFARLKLAADVSFGA
ncbi:nicotinamidase-related amidase [Rhizomicrobium palustre]|uniref:Nicotinamidase-related amidase n=1 Tax=Rhizomicrobium palustre TaxID=189966 RepID=A0A846MY41_9PROT|nr:cysteine hydrolase family protein [Rhizomicrobium palustre]NIK87972.1 nicotinamidase-related amidase [Rhizomicrobium palustre]